MFLPEFNLSNLVGFNGFTINGDGANTNSGRQTSTAGDFNGDGIPDILIGAPRADGDGDEAGVAYVVYGTTSGFPDIRNLADIDGTNGVRFDGFEQFGQAGLRVSGGGDINNDGFDDIIIGAPNSNTQADPGTAYVVFGGNSFGAEFALSSLDGDNGFALTGEAFGHQAGNAVAIVPDVNNDGFDDLMIGANRADIGPRQGRTYFIFGNSDFFPATVDPTGLDGEDGFTIDGLNNGDYLGGAVAGLGDVNGDGFGDFAVSATGFDEPGGDSNIGASYVIFGASNITGDTLGNRNNSLDLADINGGNGFRIDGADGADAAGGAIASAGDVNGDGIADIIIGASRADGDDGSEGAAYVVFGKTTPFTASIDLGALDGSDGFRMGGVEFRDFAGTNVSSAGDFNGDGFDDILVGALSADGDDGFSGTDTGVVYLILGKAGGFDANLNLADLDGTNGFRFNGVDQLENAGRVAAAGDLNGDGFDDIIIGAANADINGTSSGSTYIIFGTDAITGQVIGDNDDATNIVGSDFADTIVGRGGDDTIEGGIGDDLIDGGGQDDLLRGGIGADTLIGSAGEDTLEGGSGNDRAEGSVAADSILGEAGADTLIGNNGNDNIDGGSGGDRVLGGPGEDIVFGNTGNDDLNGNNGRDTIDGGAGADTVSGGALSDSILGDEGADDLSGNAGDDTIRGGTGGDSILGQANSDLLYGDSNNDTISGNGANDTAFGGTGTDLIRGNAGNDIVYGEAGADQLLGGNGDDVIVGGVGEDRLAGNNGRDVFIFGEGDSGATLASADLITDFSQSENDKIRLVGIDAIAGGGDDAFSFIGTSAFSGTAGELRYEQTGGRTNVFGDTDGDGTADFALQLLGNVDLVAGDFVL